MISHIPLLPPRLHSFGAWALERNDTRKYGFSKMIWAPKAPVTFTKDKNLRGGNQQRPHQPERFTTGRESNKSAEIRWADGADSFGTNDAFTVFVVCSSCCILQLTLYAGFCSKTGSQCGCFMCSWSHVCIDAEHLLRLTYCRKLIRDYMTSYCHLEEQLTSMCFHFSVVVSSTQDWLLPRVSAHTARYTFLCHRAPHLSHSPVNHSPPTPTSPLDFLEQVQLGSEGRRNFRAKTSFTQGFFPHPVNTSIVRGLNPSNVSPLPARALKLCTCPVHPSIFQCIRQGLRHRCYSSCKAGTSVEHSCLDPGVLSSKCAPGTD